MKIDAAAVAFLRFKALVYNPTNVYCRPFKSINDWLELAQEHDPHWSKCSKHRGFPFVQSVTLPGYFHNALASIDCPYQYELVFPSYISTKLTVKQNNLRLTVPNLLTLSKHLGVSMQDFSDVFIPYLEQFELNGVQPVTDEELDTMQLLGVPSYIIRSIPIL